MYLHVAVDLFALGTGIIYIGGKSLLNSNIILT